MPMSIASDRTRSVLEMPDIIFRKEMTPSSSQTGTTAGPRRSGCRRAMWWEPPQPRPLGPQATDATVSTPQPRVAPEAAAVVLRQPEMPLHPAAAKLSPRQAPGRADLTAKGADPAVRKADPAAGSQDRRRHHGQATTTKEKARGGKERKREGGAPLPPSLWQPGLPAAARVARRLGSSSTPGSGVRPSHP
jgi:hypothetical protein